jgi:hypothetical protein
MSLNIPKELKDDILNYCKINDISNVDDFIIKMIKQGHTIERYGAAPNTKEKIVEKIIEVEKIVEKVIEVPVEKIIEKIIEKEVLVSDNTEIIGLTHKINELETTIINNNQKYNNDFETLHLDYKKQLSEKDEIIIKLTKDLDNEKRKKRDIYGE